MDFLGYFIQGIVTAVALIIVGFITTFVSFYLIWYWHKWESVNKLPRRNCWNCSRERKFLKRFAAYNTQGEISVCRFTCFLKIKAWLALPK